MMDNHLNEKLADAVMKIGRVVKHGLTSIPKVAQLTLIQTEILMCLKHHKKIKGSEIAKYFHISKSTASIHLDKLVQQRLVDKAPDKTDRRIDWLTLTIKGKKLLDEGLKHRNCVMNNVFNLISKHDKQTLLDIIDRLLIKLNN